ncbi:MAG: hypothetical protein MJZ61_06775 [Bacteroidales bacterium]|nr:hypothetical protein [Bacteroidales bacterium]
MKLIIKTLLAVIMTSLINYACGQNYLTFTAKEGNVEIGMKITGAMQLPNIEFSFDQTNWMELMDDGIITLANIDDKVYLRGYNPEGLSSEENFCTFSIKGKTAASGSIMSLIDGEGTSTEIPKNYCFHQLFTGCENLTSAPELPATTLAEGCYQSMFSGCTNLSHGITLPATVLPQNSYTNMFHGCSNLEYIIIEAVSFNESSAIQWLDNTSENGVLIHPTVSGVSYDELINQQWTEVHPISLEDLDYMNIKCDSKVTIEGKTYYPSKRKVSIEISKPATNIIYHKLYFENPHSEPEQKEIEIIENEDGLYTFDMPNYAISIKEKLAYLKSQSQADTSGYCEGKYAEIDIEYDGNMDIGIIHSIDNNGGYVEDSQIEKLGDKTARIKIMMNESLAAGTQKYSVRFRNGDIISEPVSFDIKRKVTSQEIMFLYNDVVFISNNDGNNQPQYTSFNWKVNGETVSTAQFYEPPQYENLREAVANKSKEISVEVITVNGEKVQSCPINDRAKTFDAASITKKSCPTAQVYPCPASPSQEITIHLANMEGYRLEDFSIKIFSNMGKLIKEIPKCGEYNRTTLPRGSYTGAASNGKENITFKIIVR